MTDSETVPGDAIAARPRLPWFVKVSPEFYDDASDTGYGWEGWTVDADDAIRLALEQCHFDNDREADQFAADTDLARAKVHVAEIDFRRLAGPLVHWAQMMGGWDAPVWRALERAVASAGLSLVAFEDPEARMAEPTNESSERVYLFDVKLLAAVPVHAADEATARQRLSHALDCATFRSATQTGGDPIQFEASTDGEADLIEIDGRAC